MKMGIQKKSDWIPDQVGNDRMTKNFKYVWLVLYQSLKTRNRIMAAKNSVVCQSFLRLCGGSGNSMAVSLRFISERLKTAAMMRPITKAKPIEPITRAKPISKPSTRAERKIAMTLMAGPEYRKALAQGEFPHARK